MAHDGFSEDYVISRHGRLVHFSCLADSAVQPGLLYLDVSVPLLFSSTRNQRAPALLMKYVKYELQFRVQCGEGFLEQMKWHSFTSLQHRLGQSHTVKQLVEVMLNRHVGNSVSKQ